MFDYTSAMDKLQDKILHNVLKKLSIDIKQDKIKYLKCKYALESLLVSIPKTIIIYTCSILLGVFYELLFFQISYIFLRHYGFGAHAENNLKCLIVSMVIFLTVPYLVKSNILVTPTIFHLGILVLNFIIILLYAPSCTKKNYIEDKNRRNTLRNKTLICNFILSIIVILNSNQHINNLIIYGSFCAALFMLPITHRIVNNDEKNPKE